MLKTFVKLLCAKSLLITIRTSRNKIITKLLLMISPLSSSFEFVFNMWICTYKVILAKSFLVSRNCWRERIRETGGSNIAQFVFDSRMSSSTDLGYNFLMCSA